MNKEQRKLVFLIADGMGDWPLEELDGRTPLEAAETPNLDRMAASALQGLCQTVPDGLPPGSDVANMSLLGFDPGKYHTGRGPIEAAAQGIVTSDNDLIWRLNLVTLHGQGDQTVMLDYSAGHIETAQSMPIINDLQATLGDDKFTFYHGVQYRHLLVQHKAAGTAAAKLYIRPPHDILDKTIAPDYEAMAAFPEVYALMRKASERVASRAGKSKANAVWAWGQGAPLRLPDFKQMFNLEGAVISAVDLVKGLGRAAGMTVLEVKGATGDLNTNYHGKVRAVLEFMERGDFVYLHLEAPDECGHSGDCAAKVRSIELFDQRIVGPLLDALGDKASYLVTCDHLTPLSLRTHASDPVPFLYLNDFSNASEGRSFSEKSAAASGLFIPVGSALLPWCCKNLRSSPL